VYNNTKEATMPRKIIPISFPEEIHRKLKLIAEKEHLALSTWIRKTILDFVNGEKK
jgi:predicted HicB family RNase H-like nuclease